MHDIKIANLGNLGREENQQQPSRVAPWTADVAAARGRGSASLLPAVLPQSQQLCQSCLGGESFATEKEHLLM